MDVGNFNKNVLKYNHRNTCKRLSNIKKEKGTMQMDIKCIYQVMF